MDLGYLVNQIKATPQGMRLRQGKVIATHNSPKSVDIQIAGDTNTLPRVKYLHSYAPQVDDIVFILSIGADLLVLGDIAQ